MGITIALSLLGIIVDIAEQVVNEAADLLFMPLLQKIGDAGIPGEHKRQIDPIVWATRAHSPGLMQVPPVHITRNVFLPVPRIPQYPLTP